MSDEKPWDGRIPYESNEMYQWRQGVQFTLAALGHSIRSAPGADAAELDKIFEFLQETLAPKEKGSIEHLAFMGPVLSLKHMQAYTPEGEPILKDTREKR